MAGLPACRAKVFNDAPSPGMPTTGPPLDASGPSRGLLPIMLPVPLAMLAPELLPMREFAALLPSRVLSRLLPVPLTALEPVRIRFSTLEPSV